MQLTTRQERQANLDRGLRLEYFTLAWNILEAIVGIAAGIAAGSVALVGFALDSTVESSSAGILIWRLRAERAGTHAAEDAERKAIRLGAIAFLALAAYIGIRAAFDLVGGSEPDESIPGIVLAIGARCLRTVLHDVCVLELNEDRRRPLRSSGSGTLSQSPSEAFAPDHGAPMTTSTG